MLDNSLMYLIILKQQISNTTEISKVHFGDELWFRSGDRWALFVEKGHHKQSKVGM